jgi:hypothetical protein
MRIMTGSELRLVPCDESELAAVLRQLAGRGCGFLGCCPQTEPPAVMRRRLERAEAHVFRILGADGAEAGIAAFAVNPANPFQATIDVLPAEHAVDEGADQVRAVLLFGTRFLALVSFLRFGQIRDAAERHFISAGFEEAGSLPGALFQDGAYREQRVLHMAEGIA